jgi:hypothetical protein
MFAYVGEIKEFETANSLLIKPISQYNCVVLDLEYVREIQGYCYNPNIKGGEKVRRVAAEKCNT